MLDTFKPAIDVLEFKSYKVFSLLTHALKKLCGYPDKAIKIHNEQRHTRVDLISPSSYLYKKVLIRMSQPWKHGEKRIVIFYHNCYYTKY